MRQILATWRFHLITVLVLAAEVAIACTVICNTLYVIVEQAGPVMVPAGVVRGEVIVVPALSNPAGLTKADIETAITQLSRIPGVQAVSVGMGFPYTSAFRADGNVHSGAGHVASASVYLGDGLVDALGLDLVAGRKFAADEIRGASSAHAMQDVSTAIITEALGRQLFPDGKALGKQIVLGRRHDAPRPVVIGIVRQLTRRQPLDVASAGNAVLLPLVPDGSVVATIVVRADGGRRQAVMAAMPEILDRLLPKALPEHVHPTTFEQLRRSYFRSRRDLIYLLLAVTLVVVVVTGIGITGLTAFWVQRRTHQIGVRRAMGATRGAILRYFMLENFLVVGCGVLLGMIAAYAGSIWLMETMELPRMPVYWPLWGAVALWLVGQAAVLAPAMRASKISPVMAIRSA